MSTPVSAIVTDPVTGQDLGDTPFEWNVSRHNDDDVHMSLLIHRDGYKAQLRHITLTRWAKTPDDAVLSPNEMIVELERCEP